MDLALEKLQNSLSRKHYIPIKAEFFGNEYTLEFENRLELKHEVDYQIGMIWYQGTNSIFNVTSQNNKFRYYNGICLEKFNNTKWWIGSFKNK